MKTPVEKAYDYAMKVIDDIKTQGIVVEMVIPRRVREGKYHDSVKKYHPPERLPVDKWRHVTLVSKTKEQSKFIYDKAKDLREFGIGFDTGCGCGGRDWEFDWSFSYNENNTDTTQLEILEDLIENNLECTDEGVNL